nr:hypothetical protein [Tanacetum cinerariifolium]
LPNKGIKSPSKLLSLKYQSQSSLREQNGNSSSPKRIHFINTITIIRKEDEPKEEEIVEPDAIKDNNHNTIADIKEKVEGKLINFETVLEEGMSRDIKLGNMGHTMDFTILENIEANIYPSLSQVVFGRPFIDITKLISDKEQGLITFTNGIKEVTFKTLYKDSEVDDLTSKEHDLLSSRVVLSEDDYRRGCERVSNLENGVNLDVDKLDPSYKDETYRINLDGAFEVGKSRKGEVSDEGGVTITFDEKKPESS